MILYRKTEVRRYLKETAPHVGQVSSDFWDLLDVRIRALLDRSVRRNANHSRITAAELAEYIPNVVGK